VIFFITLVKLKMFRLSKKIRMAYNLARRRYLVVYMMQPRLHQ